MQKHLAGTTATPVPPPRTPTPHTPIHTPPISSPVGLRYSHCHCSFVDGDEMRVGVENIMGRFLYVEVEQVAEEDATVGRLKTGIASEEAVQEQRMILVTQDGRVMADDGAALSQYDIREGSVIYLYFLPDGTSKWPKSAYDYLCVDVGSDNADVVAA